MWIIVVISVFMAGCQYILTEPASMCEPPNKIVKDIYGNEVCVTPEVEELPTATTGLNGTSTGNVTGPANELPAQVIPADGAKEEKEVSGALGLPRKVVTEGETVSFPNLKATDPDGDPISYTFLPPLNAQGEWKTKVGEAGEYQTTITASDGVNEVRQQVIIVVLSANKAPSITGIEQRMTVEEGDTITLDPVVTDADGDDVIVTYSGWMDSPTYKTNYADAGSYVVTISASDSKTSSTKRIDIVVENVNRPPVIDQIEDLEIEVGEEIVITPKARDPDGDDVGFTFSSPLDASGKWVPAADDDGEYVITVTASDDEDSDMTTFRLVVGTPNRPPVFESLSDISVNEGETIVIDPKAKDPEGAPVSFRYTGWMTSSTYKTTYDDAGTYSVTITVSDGENEVSQAISVVVVDMNRPPVFERGAFN